MTTKATRVKPAPRPSADLAELARLASLVEKLETELSSAGLIAAAAHLADARKLIGFESSAFHLWPSIEA